MVAHLGANYTGGMRPSVEPQQARLSHSAALRWLTIANGLAGVLHAEGYARAAGQAELAAAVFVRFATFAQVFALCALGALLLSPLAQVAPGRRALRALVPVLFAALHAALLVDRTVFGLFHFHLNRMVLGLVLAPGGISALELTRRDVVLAGSTFAGLVVLEAALHGWALRRAARAVTASERSGARWRPILVSTLLLLMLDRTAYAVADLRGAVETLRVAAAIPTYGPIPVRQLGHLLRGGAYDARSALLVQPRPGGGELRYPLAPLHFRVDAPRPSIVWILLDGWRADAFDARVTPALSRLASGAAVFRRHVSGGNMTEFGLFSMFYGLHGTYHDSFEVAHRAPVLLSALRERGYRFGVVSSAGLAYPRARSSIFAEVPESISDEFPGDAVQRDRAATQAALAFVRARAQDRAPFLLFLFLDATHAPYSFPAETAAFTPYAQALEYIGMSEFDPVRVRNRYLNAVRFDDGLAAELIAALDGLDTPPIVLATSDHGEALGDSGRWLHNTGFGPEQTRVPLILRAPGVAPGDRDGLTRHVDLAPTLLELLGVDSPASDYGVGRSLLSAPASAEYAVTCGWAACAVIEPDGRATTFPNLVEGDGVLQAQGPRYEPLSLSDVRGPTALPAVLAEMRRFLR